MPAYPNALMQATPRNALLGRLSDALASTYGPEQTQQAQQLAQFFSVPAISRTLDKLSYGEPLTTGAGGLGGTTKFNNDALEAAFAVAPMVGPAAKLAGKGAMATGRFVAPKAGQLAEQYMVKTGNILPLDVYHGTPHTFPPTARNPLGEFDASKIGTGEGAQAYGHGIYTTESPAVAEQYQKALSRPSSAGLTKAQDIAAWAHSQGTYGVNPVDVLSEEISRLDTYGKFGAKLNRDDYVNAIKILQKGEVPTTGNLYKIDLPDEKIAKMLDWDKPMSEQHPDIQAALMSHPAIAQDVAERAGIQQRMNERFPNKLANPVLGENDITGRQIYETLAAHLGDRPAASKYLSEQGIPGVQYLDEGSRNLANTWIVKHPQGGENVFSSKASAEDYAKKYPEETLIAPKVTRNFVTFPGEEKNMTILERKGQKFDNSALMK